MPFHSCTHHIFKTSPRRFKRILLILSVSFALGRASAIAGNYLVTASTDSGQGSGNSGDLRYCILQANSAGGSSFITFDAAVFVTAKIISLGSPLPIIISSLTITGPAAGVTLDGANSYQVLRVTGGVVALNNLTIANGRGNNGGSGANGSNNNNGNGGNAGRGGDGSAGGLQIDGGAVTLTSSTLANNTGGHGGDGGIGGFGLSGGGGLGGGGGKGGSGGLQINGASVAVISCTFRSNTGGSGGSGGEGGSAIGSVGGRGGSGDIGGGGAVQISGTATVTNSTFSGNAGSAGGAGGAAGGGSFALGGGGDGARGGSGGLQVNAGSGILINSTVASNAAGSGGSGGRGDTSGSPGSNGSAGTAGVFGNVSVGNSLFKNSGGNMSGAITSQGYNLSSDAAEGDGGTGPDGLLNASGDIRNTDPLLASLASNGGPTQTIALRDNSPAIDAGKDLSGTGKDQRGQTRPADISNISNAPGGDGSDIGAYEAQDHFTSFVVTKIADTDDGVCDADCSLREAINAANTDLGAETITFDPAVFGTAKIISLGSPLPIITSSLTIAGPAAGVTLDGAATYQVLRVTGGAVVLSNLTISNGRGSTGTSGGKGSDGTVGGLELNGGSITLTNATFANNVGGNGGDGGAGVFGGGAGGNGGKGGSGALQINGGSAAVSNCTFAGNIGGSGGKGGNGGDGDLNSGFSVGGRGGSGDLGGAGAVEISGTATLTNSTFSGNAAGVGGAGGAAGSGSIRVYGGGDGAAGGSGGLQVNAGSAVMINCTTANNTGALGGSGGLGGSGPGNSGSAGTGGVFGSITIGNSIFKNNGGNVSGAISSQGYNLSSDAAGGDAGTVPGGFLNSSGDIRNTVPQLAALADNGGLTRTIALLANSPGVDKGKDLGGSGTDQRGFPRPKDYAAISNANGGDGSDIGAFEVQDIQNGIPSFVVNDTNDNDGLCGAQDCSLRQAITATKVVGISSPITFLAGLSGTITLLTPLASLTSNITVPNPDTIGLTITRGSDTSSAVGAITLGADVAFNIAPAGSPGSNDLAISAPIGEPQGTPHSLTKTGAGTMLLAAGNTYSGGTFVNAGTLAAGFLNYQQGAFAAGSAITVNSGATLRFDGTDPLGWGPGKAGALILAGGTAQSAGTSQHVTIGTVTMTGATLSAYGAGDGFSSVYFLSGPITTLPSATVSKLDHPDGIGAVSITGGVTFDVARGTTVDGVDLLVSAPLNQRTGDTVSLIKAGAGTMVLSAVNTYAGLTSVNAGILCLAGSLANTTSVTVSSGATLCLNGGSVGNVTTVTTINPGGALSGGGAISGAVHNNGTVSVGAGQTLTLTGDVTNDGTMIFRQGATLNAGGATSFVNNGTIDYLSGNATFPANFSNGARGVVVDSSKVKVKGISKIGTAVNLTIQSYSGHTYRLQSTPALGTTAFQSIGNPQSGDGSVLTFTDSSAPSHAGFYRIAVDP